MKQVINLLNKHEAEKDKMAAKLNAEIAERIEGLKMLDRYVVPQQTNDALIEELKDRIIELKDDLEIQRNVNEHMIKAHKAEMAQLKEEYEAKIAELTNDKLDDIVKKHVEGGDAMEQPKAQPKKNNSPLFNRLMNALEEEEQPKEETVIEEIKEVIEETNEDYKLTWKQMIFDEKVNNYSVTMAAIHGTITIKDKTYKYLAYNYLYYPIVYDCFDKEITEITKEEIKKHVKNFNFYYELTENDVNFEHANDKDYKMISWRALDVNGYTTYHANVKLRNHQTIELAYDKNKCDKIMKTAVRSLFNDKPAAWRYLDEKYKELADKFMATWPENFSKEVPQDTNEIVVDFTNDPTAGCDDLDI